MMQADDLGTTGYVHRQVTETWSKPHNFTKI